MIILTQIQICQSHHCLIVNHHSPRLLEGARAIRGKEQVMGAALGMLGEGLKNSEHWQIFLTEYLYVAYLVRIWVTMYLIVLTHILEWRIGSHFVWGKFEFCVGDSLHFVLPFWAGIACIWCGDNLYIVLEFCVGVVCEIPILRG